MGRNPKARLHASAWQQPGATFFITFRLVDSIPQSKLDAWKQERSNWLAIHTAPWNDETEREYHRKFSSKLDVWLDEGHGECVLRSSHIAAEVEKTLRKFDGARYAHHLWVIMPNHVHTLCTLTVGERLEKTVQGWKGVSANLVNKLLNRKGTLWQENYYDRLVRDGDHFWNCARYIRRNPQKARLQSGNFVLWESDAVKRKLDECGI